MFGLDPGTADVIAASIVSAGGVIGVMLGLLRRDVKNTRRDVETARTHLTKLDESVNGKTDEQLPLIRRVDALETDRDVILAHLQASDRWTAEALKVIGEQVGAAVPDRKWYH